MGMFHLPLLLQPWTIDVSFMFCKVPTFNTRSDKGHSSTKTGPKASPASTRKKELTKQPRRNL